MFPTGVTVVTAAEDPPVGVTVSSFNSVSLQPPLVLFSIGHDSTSLDALRSASGYAVNVLAASQEDISNRFARAGGDKWGEMTYELGYEGSPLIEGALAHFECRPHAVYDGGDHDIFVGEVVGHRHNPGEGPLVFFSGGYRGLSAAE